MLKTLKLRNISIGEGIPKIAVSITGTTKEEIMNLAKQIDVNVVDLLEWRADFYEDVFQIDSVLEILKILRGLFQNTPIIFTFRTKDEGGAKDIDLHHYSVLNKAVSKSGYVELIDIQISLDNNTVKEIIKYIHNQGVFVIGSNHEFTLTPVEEEMIKRAVLCNNLGADIIKLAFMPNEIEDVLNLLYITTYIKTHIDKPIITMAMGKLGIISRISGETFGSSVTFASMGKMSAPGQIPVENLHSILNWIH